MNLKKMIVAALCMVMLLSATACGGTKSGSKSAQGSQSSNSAAAEKAEIKLSTTQYNYDEVNADCAIKAMEAKGYKVSVAVFQDASTQNQAILNGEVDASLQQHQPFLNSYNQSKNTNLVMITPYIHKCEFGFYSMKYKSVDELPDGATVVIGSDASNMARALIFLKSLGLVDYDSSITAPSPLDITKNPKNIQFKPLDTQQEANSLPDVDGVCVSRMNIIGLNYSVKDTELCVADEGDTYGVGFVVTDENKDAQWVKDLEACYTTAEMKDFINARYAGAFTPAF